MEWERAKTILIVLLALLNAGLFAMGAAGKEDYALTREDVSVITGILSENGITLSCGLPQENKPARLMNLQASQWDYDYIESTFFPGEKVTRILEEGSIIYRTEAGGREAVVMGAAEGVPELVYTEERASFEAPEEYLSLMGKGFSGFERERLREDSSGKRYLFNDTVNGSVVFSSEAEVSFFGGGASVRVRKLDFVSYITGTHEIARADEALLAFMRYKNENIEGDVSIEAVQLGYGAEGGPRESSLRAKPYYRIFLEGEDEPVMIDAVMNTVAQ